MSIAPQTSHYELNAPGHSPRPNGNRRPPTLGAALRRYPVLVMLPVVLLAAAGVTLGQRRAPTYKASTQINVSVPTASSNQTPGFAQAAQELASSYSRQINSRPVKRAVSRKLHVPYAEVSRRLSSSAVPSSPTFYVNATGSSSREAVRIAGAATAALRAEIRDNARTVSPQSLLAQYKNLQGKANELSSASGKLKGDNAAGVRKVPKVQLQAAELASQTAALQAQAMGQRYTQAVAQAAGPSLSVLNPARTATSDKRSITERYGIIGLAAGLVIGAALALLVARLMSRRALRPR